MEWPTEKEVIQCIQCISFKFDQPDYQSQSPGFPPRCSGWGSCSQPVGSYSWQRASLTFKTCLRWCPSRGESLLVYHLHRNSVHTETSTWWGFSCEGWLDLCWGLNKNALAYVSGKNTVVFFFGEVKIVKVTSTLQCRYWLYLVVICISIV